MIRRIARHRVTQSAAVVLCAAAVKLHYSAADADQLRWILTPTAAAVGLLSGERFEYEAHAGYVNGERSFVIAPSCAGVNFLITSFLVLSLRRLWGGGARETHWGLIPCAALAAYLATLAANAVRIGVALSTRGLPPVVDWLSPDGLHRLEGVSVYFGFLLLLFAAAEKVSPEGGPSAGQAAGLFRRPLFPLLVYYATTLGVPVLNGAHRRGPDFREHALFVLLVPLALALAFAALRFYRSHQSARQLRGVKDSPACAAPRQR
jgi:exosortase K